MKKIRRLLSLLLALTMLLAAFPAATADEAPAAEAPQEQALTLPYTAKLKTGTVLYADKNLTQIIGTLASDAQVILAAEEGNAAKIRYAGQTGVADAWVKKGLPAFLSQDAAESALKPVNFIPEPELEVEPQPEPDPQPDPEPESEPEPEVQPEPEPEVEPEPEPVEEPVEEPAE